ncbi:hypothetical protein E4U36_008246, partial [Claviceps purpurea]
DMRPHFDAGFEDDTEVSEVGIEVFEDGTEVSEDGYLIPYTYTGKIDPAARFDQVQKPA